MDYIDYRQQMEQFSKTHSTMPTRVMNTQPTVFDFNNRKQKQNKRQEQVFESPEYSYNVSQCKNQQNEQQLNDLQSYFRLQSMANSLSLELARIKQLNNSTANSPIFEQAIHQNSSKYSEVTAHNLQIQKSLKLQIVANSNKIDNQIQQMMKNRIQAQKKWEKQTKENIQQVVQTKQKSLKQYAKFSKSKFQGIGNQIKLMGQEVKQFVKQNQEFKAEVFGKLNTVRLRLAAQVKQQQARRKSYDEIVHELLEKTCHKSQEMLRRKL